MKAAVQRVHDALLARGVEPRIVEFSESTRTAEEAALAIGTTVERIVKSLVFASDDQPILALVSGGNRVATARLAEALGAPVRRADAEMVRAATGFAIGGVPPLGHATELTVVLDEDLLGYDLVYAAAGTPNTVFPITPEELLRVTRARVVTLKERGA
ncbi:MAG TPA: YbaK/EbsC family protein [Chloroflexota bacterium]|jgi:prolyl-tRNA editing enzyme YbaK/EbsC (Cys-tRNA(Pro) deacylase)